MPLFDVTGPDGKEYEVDAPSMEAVQDVVRQMFGGATPQTPGGTDTPPLARAPELMGQPEERGLGRSLMLGAQAVGRGAVEAVLSPVDLAARAANFPLMVADAAADQFGGRVPFRFGEDLGDRAANTAGKIVESAGVPLAEPEGIGEKAAYEATRFGTQALTASGILNRIARFLTPAKPAPVPAAVPAPAAPAANVQMPFGFGMDALLRPYAQNPARVLTGDAASGAAGGAALAGSREYLPQEYRDAGGGLGGVMADLFAQLVGGTAGGISAEIARGLPVSAGRRIANSLTDTNFPVDPETGIPFRRGQVQRAAIDYQADTTDPKRAASNIARETDYYRGEGLPVPTSGLMSDDLGLAGVERGQRDKLSVKPLVRDQDATPEAKRTYNFVERDNALQTRAVEEVDALTPPGSEPRRFTDRANEVAQTQRDVAQRGVDQAAGQQRGVTMARSGPAADVQAFEGQGARASANIDRTVRDTRVAERARKNEAFNDPVLTQAEVPVDPLRETAARIAGDNTQAAPNAPIVQKYVDRYAAMEAGQPITMREANAVRAELEDDIVANSGNGEVVRQLRQFKDTINQYTDTLAGTDAPAAEAARTALDTYRERFGPNFRSGAGGQFDKALTAERKPGAPEVKASETGARFLTTPEDANALMRIARLGGNEADVAAQARVWLFDKLAQKGIGRDGAVDAEALTRWRNLNDDLLGAVPGLRAEVNQMVAAARRGEGLADDAANALRTAEQNARNVDQNIRRGPLGLVEGAAPPEAVAQVLSASDPRAAMREIVRTVGRNQAARDGLKNAVAAHLIDKTTTALGDRLGQRAAKVFERNREALAELYTPEEMNRLVRAQKLVEPLDLLGRAKANPGSTTAERSANWLLLEVLAKIRYGMLKGGGIMSNLKKTTGAIFKGQDEAVERIKMIAAFSPEGAQHLLTLKTQKPGTPGYNATLQKLIRLNEALNTVNENDKEDEEARPRNEITVTPRPQ